MVLRAYSKIDMTTKHSKAHGAVQASLFLGMETTGFIAAAEAAVRLALSLDAGGLVQNLPGSRAGNLQLFLCTIQPLCNASIPKG